MYSSMNLVRLSSSSRVILTDSGGLQKEAYWLGVPCVTLRDETEWVETIEQGWNVLAGANSEKILTCVRGFQPPTDWDYADPAANNASMEIARFILKNEAASCNVGSQPAATPVS
jgi:UDP-N-acetylglucosamine 2-epimerase